MAEASPFQKGMNPQQQAAHGGKPSPESSMFNRIAKNVNNLSASLRILEERYSNLRNKTQLSEQNIIDIEKDMSEEIKMLSEDVVDLKRQIKDINDKLKIINNEIKNLVNKNDFKVVERYLDMWQPMNFVTRNELDKLLDNIKTRKE